MRASRWAILVVAVSAGGVWAQAAGAVNFPVTSVADAGANTLRAAIVNANAAASADTISFAIPGAGLHTINITSAALPASSGPVAIQGTTQPGYAGVPLIRLNNATGIATAAGLNITGGTSSVTGLDITGFGAAIVLANGDGNTVASNYLGLTTGG